jgi:hypothetical protein
LSGNRAGANSDISLQGMRSGIAQSLGEFLVAFSEMSAEAALSGEAHERNQEDGLWTLICRNMPPMCILVQSDEEEFSIRAGQVLRVAGYTPRRVGEQLIVTV